MSIALKSSRVAWLMIIKSAKQWLSQFEHNKILPVIHEIMAVIVNLFLTLTWGGQGMKMMSPVDPFKGPAIWGFGVFFSNGFSKKLSKQSSCWWFKMPEYSCDITVVMMSAPLIILPNYIFQSLFIVNNMNIIPYINQINTSGLKSDVVWGTKDFNYTRSVHIWD